MDWINIAVAAGLVVLCVVAIGLPAFAATWFTWLVVTVAALLALGAIAGTLANSRRRRNGG